MELDYLDKKWASILPIQYIPQEFLKQERKKFVIYPPEDKVFSAFNLCSFEDTKVVILGQDPYINENQAMGLSFSVPKGEKLPGSLKNIYKELKNDIRIDSSESGDLTPWAEQGVLLLNSVLTVRAGESGSHKGRWEKFTDSIISKLNEREKQVVFILWGSYARGKKKLITNSRHLIIEGNHPSPLSANKGGFFGGKYFSRCNDFLTLNHEKPIDWKVLNKISKD